MKNLKCLFFLSVVALSVAMFSCSKSGDPTPTTAQKTALDSVKSAMTGTWKFTSLKVTQVSSGKTASTSNCSKSELSTAGFGNTNYVPVTPEFNYTYGGSTSGTMSNACAAVSTSASVSATLNSDKTVTVTINGGGTAVHVYNVKSTDISPNTIKATLISDGSTTSSGQGYSVLITFSRS